MTYLDVLPHTHSHQGWAIALTDRAGSTVVGAIGSLEEAQVAARSRNARLRI